MNQTMEMEINKEFNDYVVLYKTMSKDRTKGFYTVYGKDAIVFAYLLKQKIRYKYLSIAKVVKKMLCFNKKSDEKNKKEKVFTSTCTVPLYKLNEVTSVLNYNHVNYMIVDKIENCSITTKKEFKANKYDECYTKGLRYKRIIPKINSIIAFLRGNSDSGEIMYLIYDIERCIDDFKKREERRKRK